MMMMMMMIRDYYYDDDNDNKDGDKMADYDNKVSCYIVTVGTSACYI